MLTSNQFQRRSPRKKSDAAETLEQTKAVHLVRSHRCTLTSAGHQATDAKEADPAPSVAGNKRMFHPDPLKPEQAEELGISGVAKDDNVFLVDKILDERYAKNVRAPSLLGTPLLTPLGQASIPDQVERFLRVLALLCTVH